MNKQDLAYWKRCNKNATETIVPGEYLGARGLELIENLEGHRKTGLKKVGNQWTNHYGITQEGLDGLKELCGRFNTKIPDWMVGADVRKLNRKQCAEITQYIAAMNTMLVDAETETGNFSSWDLPQREAFLSYFHNESPYRLRSSLKQGAEGSVLHHIKNDNPYRALQALLENSDGSFHGEYVKPNGERDGYVKRCLVAAFAYGNPDFSYSPSEAGALENRMRMPGFVKESHDRLRQISDHYAAYGINASINGDAFQEMSQDGSEVSIRVPQSAIDKAEAKKAAETKKSSFAPATGIFAGMGKLLSDFTNGMKNLLNSTQEDENAAKRNQDVNLQ